MRTRPPMRVSKSTDLLHHHASPTTTTTTYRQYPLPRVTTLGVRTWLVRASFISHHYLGFGGVSVRKRFVNLFLPPLEHGRNFVSVGVSWIDSACPSPMLTPLSGEVETPAGSTKMERLNRARPPLPSYLLIHL